MEKLYVVELLEEQRWRLRHLIAAETWSARILNRAHILLLADEGRTDADIAAALHVSQATVQRTRRRFVQDGLEATMNERRRCGGPRTFTGKHEAMVIALACSAPPEGQQRWTLQLLADRLVELKVVDTISDETVRRILKKTTPSPGCARNGACPA